MEKIGFGVAPAKIDLRDYKIRYKGVATASNFPKEFSLKMPRVKYQGQVGSCVAHSLSTVIEYFNEVETQKDIEMSTAYIYGNRRNSSWKKEGMRVRDALKNACEYGDVPIEYMPKNMEIPDAITQFENCAKKLINVGKVNRIKKFFKITSESAMKKCLMSYGPILVIIKWYSNNYVDGRNILNITNNKKYYDGQHCMVCYGWNEEGWKIQNSWGLGWAKMGRTILPFNSNFVEVWGLVDEENIKEEDLELIKPYNTQASQLLAKGINSIINFILKKE